MKGYIEGTKLTRSDEEIEEAEEIIPQGKRKIAAAA